MPLTTTLHLYSCVLYLGRGFALLVLPVLLAVGILMVAWLVARAFNESHVVIIGACGPCQDAHEVTVVAKVFQQAWHPPEVQEGETSIDMSEKNLCYTIVLCYINKTVHIQMLRTE